MGAARVPNQFLGFPRYALVGYVTNSDALYRPEIARNGTRSKQLYRTRGTKDTRPDVPEPLGVDFPDQTSTSFQHRLLELVRGSMGGMGGETVGTHATHTVSQSPRSDQSAVPSFSSEIHRATKEERCFPSDLIRHPRRPCFSATTTTSK